MITYKTQKLRAIRLTLLLADKITDLLRDCYSMTDFNQCFSFWGEVQGEKTERVEYIFIHN